VSGVKWQGILSLRVFILLPVKNKTFHIRQINYRILDGLSLETTPLRSR